MRLIDKDALLKELNDLFEWCRDSRSAGLEQAMCMIHEQPTIAQWIPVSERLPEVGRNIWVIGCGRNGCVDVYWTGSTSWIIASNKYDGKVIAWMPLPEPYKVGDTE